LRYRALSMSYIDLKQDIEGILAKTIQNEDAHSISYSALSKVFTTSSSDMSI
jgi:hypothetical protein